MLINKWELLRSFTKGMSTTATGNTKSLLQAVVKQMDILDKIESAERDRLMNLQTDAVQENGFPWEGKE